MYLSCCSQGMPESWAKLLQHSNISRAEQQENPQAVLAVLKYYDTSNKPQQNKYMGEIPPDIPNKRKYPKL